jgi:hypothetical protein
VAVAKAVPANGTFPLTFHLDGSGSFDPLGVIVNSSWKLPDGSIASGVETDWRPEMQGTFQATLTVIDDDGLTDSASVSFSTSLSTGGTFIDDNGHFAEGAIEAIFAVGVTRGCNPPTNNRFCPDADVTREQMAAFLARALGLSATSTDHFDDDNGSVLESAINRLAEAGITVGCNPPANTNFCPGDPVTRAEMAAFLARAFDLKTLDEDHFVDDDGSVFETAINRLAEAGITVGCNPPAGDRYCPDSPVERGQMAVFLARAIPLRPIYPPSPD